MERRTRAHSHSPSTVTSPTMGPSSNNSICTVELFAARSILFDAHQAQLLLQHTNLQLRVLQPALQLCDKFHISWC
jgi:hypothetical protein